MTCEPYIIVVEEIQIKNGIFLPWCDATMEYVVKIFCITRHDGTWLK